MNAGDWKKLFSSIRPDEQSDLVVSIVGGVEIAVSQVSRAEDSVVLIRGRLQGQADTNRVFIVPYENIAVVYVNRSVMNEEVDLYSPSVTPEKKKEIARMVAEIEAKNREAARQAEAAKNQGLSGTVPVDVRRQLDALREIAQTTGVIQGPPATPSPSPSSAPASEGSRQLPPPPPPRQLPGPHGPNSMPTIPKMVPPGSKPNP